MAEFVFASDWEGGTPIFIPAPKIYTLYPWLYMIPTKRDKTKTPRTDHLILNYSVQSSNVGRVR